MLLQLVLVVCGSASGSWAYSPFDVVDDYVSEFEHSMYLLKTAPPVAPVQHGEAEKARHQVKDASAESEEYDFIVVGSGASGSALASRLSEIPEWKVLLLEAGTREDAVTKVPAMQHYLRTTSYNWPYKTVPQNMSCLGTENQQCSIGTGRALGGESAINDMLYTRGDPKDYDTWADKDLIGWCWDSVMPYFKKIEDAFCSDLDRKHHQYGKWVSYATHNTPVYRYHLDNTPDGGLVPVLGGPVHLENMQHTTHLVSRILEAAHELGIKPVDYNGKERLGFSRPQVTTKDGKRHSAASAYLTQASKRSNLVIKPDSRVTEVTITDHTKEAKGVKYYHDGEMYTAKATKEVILAAGAVNTAHILLSSGIGPKHDLEALETPVVADLPVGKNLKDHVTFIGLNFVLNNTEHEDKNFHECQNEVVEYLRYGKGPLTTTGLELVGFLQTEASKTKLHHPDVQFLFTTNLYNQGHENLKHLNIRKDIYDAVWAPIKHKQGFSIDVVLLHPKSAGYVKLHHKDPFSAPIINPNSLTDQDEEDLETILAGVNKALKLVRSEALHKHGYQLNAHQIPECDHDGFVNDHYWRCAIKYLSVNARHLSGTARMGAEGDKEAVVDKDLRVYGVHNLRVADSSVIPVTISGNLMAAEYMIGEQAAAKIKTDWLKEKCRCEG
ncbi:hypothetical protein NQ315_002325 [Exocentrus adspersus]|uniref:Uncharacterized protein n=1 Tax=Exocentrus adspersus TaxID=1586481 RepID=A0AAV8VTC6_9CUCU|nr:hypothetical protein NQ315_002325 [Exocentrus adspersus]